MRFLIGTIPAVGHINPILPIARKLVERGHEVWWYTGKLFQSKVEATGARYVPIVTGLDFSDITSLPESLIQKRNSLIGLDQFKFDIKHFFIDSAVGQVKDLTEVLRSFPADVILGDLGFLGASWLYEQGGPPWAVLGVSGLAFTSRDTAPFGLAMQPDASRLGRLRNGVLNWGFQRILLNEVTVHMTRVRSQFGLAPDYNSFFDAVVSPFLYLQATIPEFEYPRSDLPPQVHFIGTFLPDPPVNFTPPVWWDDLQSGKPVVHVTQGTVATSPSELIVPTLQALADEDVLVVATTGGEPVETIPLNVIPQNARIEPFIPHFHLLPHVDVMVTNGGYNGVQTALAFGVPLVAAGQSEEKPEVCVRVEWAGVGINLKTKAPTPNQVKDAVKKILTSPAYRQKAKHLQVEIARYDSPTLAASLLEKLAVTKQPIFR